MAILSGLLDTITGLTGGLTGASTEATASSHTAVDVTGGVSTSPTVDVSAHDALGGLLGDVDLGVSAPTFAGVGVSAETDGHAGLLGGLL